VLIKTEILSFVLKQKPSTPPNLMMEDNMGTMSVPSRTLCLTAAQVKLSTDQWGYLVF